MAKRAIFIRFSVGQPAFFVLYGMQKEKLIALIKETVEGSGAQLVDCLLGTPGPATSIEVFADTEQGITIGELAVLTKAVQRELRMVLGPDADVQLTVSSPGLDRPLAFEWQYRRHAGRSVRMETGADRRIVEGILTGARDGMVTVQTGDILQAIPLPDVATAVIVR